MAVIKKRYLIFILAGFLLGTCLVPVDPPTMHARLRQYILEAEYGSATTFLFAGKPGPVPDSVDSSDSLIAMLRSIVPEIRWFAAHELANRKDSRAVEAIINAMHDPDTVRVCVMAQALGRIKDPRALGPLTEAAFDYGNRDLRLCAIQSLGMIGDRGAIPKLIEALEAGNMPIAAADALARIGDDRGIQPIINAAADSELRLWMVMALGELGSSKALPYLQSLAEQNKKIVLVAAREAEWKISRLSNLKDVVHKLTNTLLTDENSKHRGWSAFKLGELHHPDGAQGLLLALSDSDDGVSGRAAAAMVRIGKPVLPIIRVNLSNNSDGKSYRYAAAIIAYIGDQSDIELLNDVMENSTAETAKVVNDSMRILQHAKVWEE